MMLFIVCMSIFGSQALKQHKNSHGNAVHGQEKNTWEVRKIQDYVQKYQQAHIAMIALGCNPMEFRYQELKNEDLYTKNVNEPHTLGDGGKVEGWIWHKGYYGNLSDEDEAEYTLDCK